MKKLKGIFREYLINIGELDVEFRLGKKFVRRDERNNEMLAQQLQLLVNNLNNRVRSNEKVIVWLIVLLCLAFAVGVFFSFYYLSCSEISGGILAGTLLTILSIIKWLHQLWKEKSTADILSQVFEIVSSGKAVDLIVSLYKKLFVPVKILILSTNPKNTRRLRLDEEISKVMKALRRSKYRDQFEIQSEFALHIDDIQEVLLDHEPHIVHFIGHGNKDGLFAENEQGNATLIDPDALAELFQLFAGQIEFVVLNACYSESQATAISRHIDYVIGMKSEITDEAGIEFAKGLYKALFAGKSIEEALQFGCNAIRIVFPKFNEHLIPVLKKGEDFKIECKEL